MDPLDETIPQPLARFRAAAMRRSVAIGWVVLIILAVQAVRVSVFAEPTFLIASAFFGMILAASALLDWDRLMRGRSGAWVAWGWTVAAVLTMAVVGQVDALQPATQPLYFGLVALSGLLHERVKHVIVTLLAALAIAINAQTLRPESVGDILIAVVSIGVVAAATAMMGVEFEREAERSSHRLAELQEQRAAFERLYAVSASLAGAESLADVLPELVGRICSYLDAQVGVVLLYVADTHELAVMSPVWVNGVPLQVGEVRTPVGSTALVSQVFRSGRPQLLDRISEKPETYGILGELGLIQAMVAPLRVEQWKVGVIAVGDPSHGAFHPDQLEVLSSLGAPAALVLSQIGRYEAAAEMSRRLEEVAQMKTDFVSVVSHELRTPLTSIIGSLDTVARPEISPGEETAKTLLSTARRQAGRLQRLIEDLLIVSRMDREAIPIQLEPVPLRQALEEAATAITSIERLTVAVDPADLVVSADPDHLSRVFLNLLDNAGKYAPGSPVEVKARRRAGMAEIRVIDHGEGIPSDQRDRVFERFTQLDNSPTRARGGTGLGLSIVKGLTEAMRGNVSLEATPGGGATFLVTMPLSSSVSALTA